MFSSFISYFSEESFPDYNEVDDLGKKRFFYWLIDYNFKLKLFWF